jgi:hypothetical protein
MNTKELKQAIASDIETLKSLDVEIIPAKIYYMGLFKLMAGGVGKLGLVVFLAIIYASVHNSTPPISGEGEYIELIIWSIIAAIFMASCAMLILLSPISQYYLIKYHLKNRLKTGELLVSKLKHFAWLFFGVFILFCVMFASDAQPAVVFLMIIFSFMGSAFIAYLVVGMEMNRVGMRTLFTVVNNFFNKEVRIKSDRKTQVHLIDKQT